VKAHTCACCYQSRTCTCASVAMQRRWVAVCGLLDIANVPDKALLCTGSMQESAAQAADLPFLRLDYGTQSAKSVHA
jgi:hypothetical protein